MSADCVIQYVSLVGLSQLSKMKLSEAHHVLHVDIVLSASKLVYAASRELGITLGLF